jgi:hypothetical protein
MTKSTEYRPKPRHYLDCEEIRGGNRAPLGSQEGLPCNWTPSDRIDSVLREHALDRVSTNFVAEVHERAANARVSPTRILDSNPNDEALDLALDSRSPRPPFRTSIVLLRDKIAIPAEQRIGCDDGRDVSEPATTKAFRFSCQSASLSIREPKAFPAELFRENAVLLLQILDHFLLVSIHLSGQQNE